MNNKEFCTELAGRLGISQKKSSNLVKCFAEQLVSSLFDADEVPFLSLGIFEIKQKEQRIMVSPSTKKRMLVPPKLALSFRPSQLLKNKYKTL